MISFLKKLLPSAWNSPYEGANFSNRRGRIPGSSPRDNSSDLNSGTRNELVKNSRYVAKNSGLAREIVKDLATYSVGTGLRVKPQAGSENWRKKARLRWDEWSRAPTICGRFSRSQVERLCSKLLDEDGEVFIYKTFDPDTNEPKIQIIESHRIGAWGNDQTSKDGILFDKWGRPSSYRYMDDEGKVRDLKASSVLHVFDPERASAARHAPTLSHSQNHIRDEIELLALEKHAAKQNADVVHILETAAPGANDSEFNPVDDGDADPLTDPATLQKITGGKVVSTKTGEKLISFESKRPSATFTGFLEHVARDASLGVLPFEFVADPSRPTGAGVRLVVTKADRQFQWRTHLLTERLIEPLWFFVIGTEIANGKLTGPSGWWRIKVGAPRRVTVDAGRERREDREDVLHGLKNLGDHFDEMGKEFSEEVEQRASELQFIRDTAERFGIDEEKLFSVLCAQSPQPNQSGQEEDEQDDPKTKRAER